MNNVVLDEFLAQHDEAARFTGPDAARVICLNISRVSFAGTLDVTGECHAA
jgi:hypothetical protein